MSSLFILLFSSLYHVPFDSRAVSESSNLEQINQLVGDLTEFVDSVNSVSSVLTLNDLALVSPVPNASSAFVSCVNNGTFVNTSGTVSCSADNHSFDSIFNTFLVKATEAYNLNMNYSILSISSVLKTPYVLTVDIVVLLNVTYYDSSWSRIINSSQDISLVGITDPLTVSTGFQRNISLPDVPFSSSFLVSSFNGNYSLVQNYVSNGFYFIDTSGPSFFDMLEGNYSANSPLGISSFVPDNISYLGNTSSYVLYQYKNSSVFNSSNLKRINISSLSTNFTLPDDYLVSMHSYNNSCPASFNKELLKVAGCCDASGCDPSCGYISTC